MSALTLQSPSSLSIAMGHKSQDSRYHLVKSHLFLSSDASTYMNICSHICMSSFPVHRTSEGTPIGQKPVKAGSCCHNKLSLVPWECHVLLDILWTYYSLLGLFSFLPSGKLLFLIQNQAQSSLCKAFPAPLLPCISFYYWIHHPILLHLNVYLPH